MKQMMVVLSAVFAPVVALSESLEYSDGEAHELSAGVSGMHVDSISLSNGSKLVLTDGDLTVDNSEVKAVGSSVLTVKQGARLLCTGSVANGKFAFYNNSKLVIDGGYVRAPSSSQKTHIAGAVNFSYEWIYWNPSFLEVHNGGTFEIDATAGGVASMIFANRSSVTVDGGSTFKLTPNDTWGWADRDYSLQVAQSNGSSFSISDSTFTFFKWVFGGTSSISGNAQCSKVSFANSTVTGNSNANTAFTFYGMTENACYGNEIKFTGDQSVAKVSVGTGGSYPRDNTVLVEGGTFTGNLSLTTGYRNRYVQTDGTYGNGVMTLGAHTNEICILGGELKCKATSQQKSLIFNANAVGCNVVFSNCTAELRTDGDTVTWTPAMAFAEGAKDSAVIVHDATVDLYGYNELNALCEGCAFSFIGTVPHIRVKSHWVTQAYQLVLGVDDTTKVGKTVSLKYALPAEPYAVAPLDGSGAQKPIKIGTSTKIVVDKGEWEIGTDKKKTFYPLVSDKNGFGDLMTAERVAVLNANAVLPEGAQLEYDTTAKVLGVRMPRKTPGLFIVVR